jgi:Holliday junction resolvase RusA-like endonuclease
MKTFKYIIHGQCPTKKNQHKIIKTGKTYRIAPTKKYREWEKNAVGQLFVQKIEQYDNHKPITRNIAVKFLIYRKFKTHADLTNLIQSCEDALERAKVIDNDRLIRSLDGSRVYFDCKEPRVEIFIKELKE